MLNLIFSWNTLWVIMWALYLPASIGLIIIVLLQKGKSSGFAGAFGVGTGSETVFGPRARKSLPVKMTYVMAGLFMFLAMSMSLVAGRVHRGVAPGEVKVSETDTANDIYNDLLDGTSSTEAPAESTSTTPETAGGMGAAETTPESAPPMESTGEASPEQAATPEASSESTAPAEAPAKAAPGEPAPSEPSAASGDDGAKSAN